jgi:hypothetical protein
MWSAVRKLTRFAFPAQGVLRSSAYPTVSLLSEISGDPS